MPNIYLVFINLKKIYSLLSILRPTDRKIATKEPGINNNNYKLQVPNNHSDLTIPSMKMGITYLSNPFIAFYTFSMFLTLTFLCDKTTSAFPVSLQGDCKRSCVLPLRLSSFFSSAWFLLPRTEHGVTAVAPAISKRPMILSHHDSIFPSSCIEFIQL